MAGTKETSVSTEGLDYRCITVAGETYRFVKVPEPIDDSLVLNMCRECGYAPLDADALTVELSLELERVSGWWAGKVDLQPGQGLRPHYRFVRWCGFVFQLHFFEAFLGGSFAAIIDHTDFSVWLMVEYA